jgi:hypothetical protein
MLTNIISPFCKYYLKQGGVCENMVKQHSEVKRSELRPVFEERKNKATESEAVKLKKYLVKISMTKPYEIVDFWVRKPDMNNVLELLIHNELFTLNPNKYFKIEVCEV